MNYLAHLSLSLPDPHSLTGNLMGDFMKGVDMSTLPPAIQQGIDNHRAIDKLTDNHPAIMALKPLFSQRYRRFSGIITDVSFDYFLTKHWSLFHDMPVKDYIDFCYRGLLVSRDYMPPRMKATVEAMAEQDWLSGYTELSQVAYALDRIAQRIRFRNQFEGAGKEVERNYDALEQAFLVLYPLLQNHANHQT